MARTKHRGRGSPLRCIPRGVRSRVPGPPGPPNACRSPCCSSFSFARSSCHCSNFARWSFVNDFFASLTKASSRFERSFQSPRRGARARERRPAWPRDRRRPSRHEDRASPCGGCHAQPKWCPCVTCNARCSGPTRPRPARPGPARPQASEGPRSLPGWGIPSGPAMSLPSCRHAGPCRGRPYLRRKRHRLRPRLVGPERERLGPRAGMPSTSVGIARNRIVVLRETRFGKVSGASAGARFDRSVARVIRRSRAKRWASGSPAAARHRGAPVSADTTVGPGSFHDVVGGG